MPLQRQTTVYSYPERFGSESLDSGKGSFEDLQPVFETGVTPSSPSTNSSSWKILRKLFKESRSFSSSHHNENANNNKKVRRASCEQHSVTERTSPTSLRN
uniref:Uncharacterized protein n=1 Tax=Clytia hemisphaerica TaxID=252671 RepID=A0A7M5XK99_9CNID